MPPTSHFGSRLRRSLLLASFVPALVEAGSRGWSADKLSTLTPRETEKQPTTGALQVGLKGAMNALDLADRRQRHPLPARRSRRGAFAASGILARSIGPTEAANRHPVASVSLINDIRRLGLGAP
jgi:hypothetical protein